MKESIHLYGIATPICLLSTAVLSGLFLPDLNGIRLAAAALGALPLIPALRQFMLRRQRRTSRKQCAFLFQILLSRVSVGDSPEQAISAASTEMNRTFGTRSPVPRSLRILDSDLRNRAPFRKSIRQFSERLDCEEASAVFSTLASVQEIGTGLDALFRTGRDLVAEHLSAEEEVESQTAQRRTEATVMMLLPFVICMLVRSVAQDYLAASFSPSGIHIFLGALFLGTCLTAGLSLHLLAWDAARAGSPDQKKARQPVAANGDPVAEGRWVSRIPALYRLRLLQSFRFASNGSPRKALKQHLTRKGMYALAGLCAGAAATCLTPRCWPLAPTLAVLLPLAQDRDLYARAQRARQRLLMDFPLFLEVMISVLHTGMSLSNALEICSNALRDPSGWLGRQIRSLQSGLRTGRPVSEGLNRMAANMDIPDVQAALSLLAQCEHTGGAVLLTMLHMQAAGCRMLRRNAMRKRMERHALLLLIPMMLHLIIILVLAGFPAFLSLSA